MVKQYEPDAWFSRFIWIARSLLLQLRIWFVSIWSFWINNALLHFKVHMHVSFNSSFNSNRRCVAVSQGLSAWCTTCCCSWKGRLTKLFKKLGIRFTVSFCNSLVLSRHYLYLCILCCIKNQDANENFLLFDLTYSTVGTNPVSLADPRPGDRVSPPRLLAVCVH